MHQGECYCARRAPGIFVVLSFPTRACFCPPPPPPNNGAISHQVNTLEFKRLIVDMDAALMTDECFLFHLDCP